ncbi:MAG TPA: hypothetical protein DCG30_02515 [Ruminococcus sp.]|nr:hypothetical protein [Ruminococcus sp.]
MFDSEKLNMLKAILAERSSGDIETTLVRYRDYLNSYESTIYENEIDYLAEMLGVEIELPF